MSDSQSTVKSKIGFYQALASGLTTTGSTTDRRPGKPESSTDPLTTTQPSGTDGPRARRVGAIAVVENVPMEAVFGTARPSVATSRLEVPASRPPVSWPASFAAWIALVGPEPIGGNLQDRLQALLRYGTDAWDHSISQGSTSYQCFLFSGSLGGEAPTTREEGIAWANNVIEGMRNLGVWASDTPERMKVLVCHEFGPNGSLQPEPNDGNALHWRYGGDNPINKDAYEGIREGFGKGLEKMNGGTVLVMGGIAVDTGNKVQDASPPYREYRIGENRGMVFRSGQPQALEFTKANLSTIDGWKDGFMVSKNGQGYAMIPADSVIPGAEGLIAISICLDCSETTTVFPMDATMVIVPGYGIPDPLRMQPTNAESAKIYADVMDTFHNVSDLAGNDQFYKTGLYELSRDLGAPVNGAARTLHAGYEFFHVRTDQAAEVIAMYEKASQMRILFQDGGERNRGVVIVTQPRRLSTVMDDTKLRTAELDMIDVQAPVASPVHDPPPEERGQEGLEDPIGESHAREMELNAGLEGEAAYNFGEMMDMTEIRLKMAALARA